MRRKTSLRPSRPSPRRRPCADLPAGAERQTFPEHLPRERVVIDRLLQLSCSADQQSRSG
jgi:hypothetical protein